MEDFEGGANRFALWRQVPDLLTDLPYMANRDRFPRSGDGMTVPRREQPPPYVSREELAWELSISENSVDEMVRRGVLPSPARQSVRGPRWSWRSVETALALFNSPTRTMNWT